LERLRADGQYSMHYRRGAGEAATPP